VITLRLGSALDRRADSINSANFLRRKTVINRS
jgi:hypothetical protein